MRLIVIRSLHPSLETQMPGITKKRSLYASDTDGGCLDLLSKAAVIDILVEFLRCEADCADIPLTAAEVGENDRVRAVLTARGDRQLPSAAALLAAKGGRRMTLREYGKYIRGR